MSGAEAWMRFVDEPAFRQNVLVTGALVAARIAPLTVLAPWLGLRSAPAIVRGAIALAFTVALAPIALTTASVRAPAGWPLLLLREALVGTLFAFMTAVPFHALEAAGRLVDTWRGANLAEVIAPPTGERTSPLGDMAMLFGVALFAALGGHRLALMTFADALRVLPVGGAWAVDARMAAFGAARAFAWSLAFAVSLAAPAGVCIVASEIAVGAVARAAPAVPAFFAAMPLRAGLGVAFMALAFARLADALPAVFRESVHRAWALLSSFGH